MTVIARAPVTPDPLSTALEDYVCGEVTVVYLLQRASPARRWLVAAVVELLPKHLEPRTTVPNAADPSCIKLPGSDLELNLWRRALPTADALAWHATLVDSSGEVELPRAPSDSKPKVMSAGPFQQEPPAPLFAYEQDLYWSETPFWGHRPGGARWRWAVQQHSASPVPPLTEPQLQLSRDWLKQRLFVDLLGQPALWGSAHLRLPNPVFRSFRERLKDRVHVDVDVELYPGQSLSGLTLQLQDVRPMGPTAVWTLPLESPRTSVTLPCEPHMLQTLVWCERRGLLYSTEPVPFVRQVSIQLNIETGTRRVAVPATSKSRGEETYDVPILTGEPVNVGQSVRGALSTVLDDAFLRRGRERAKRWGQRVFNGEVDEATAFVRELIQSARSNARIVDPYFATHELLRFGLANASSKLSVEVLTSAEHLKAASPNGKEYGDELVDAVNQLKGHAHGETLRFEIRVALGDRPPIHDRFLEIDDDLWMLGSSLNEFGNRGTVAVKVPHPPPVRELIESVWSGARPLANFVADRKASRAP